VVPVTIHLSLRDALGALTTEAIVQAAETTARSLRRDFGIAHPRLAVAGLNPHAGENGLMGEEERTIIAPAIARLRANGHDVSGPLPPDTMFTDGLRARYDVAICMYHDQALIPLKTLDMAQGVNVTIGLDLVRTSPDHGTAFDIAGKNLADPTSLLAALRLADGIRRNRLRANRSDA
jgi:4-hydroxythreonine-4-phosphate dehydrogenase